MKKFPVSEKKNKYGIIIPARNEELVVGNLIESIEKSNYDQEKLKIFVVAHNCTDKTAEIVRQYPNVELFEYNNKNENTMGFAFKALFQHIHEKFGVLNYDGFFIFNADNIVDYDYFNKMNDAFNYYQGKSVITSFRNSKNFYENIISGLYGVYFALGCFGESRGRTALNLSTRVQGTGYLINSNLVKDGWKYTSLTEDWEFTADQITAGNSIHYCDEAIFYDEQPTNLKIMYRQRIRWSKGHLLVFKNKFKEGIKTFFKKGIKNRLSLYDTIINCSPFCLLLIGLLFLHIFLLLLTPAVSNLTLWQAFIDYDNNASIAANLFFSNGFLFHAIRVFIYYYVVMIIFSSIILFIGRKRFPKGSFIKKILICLLFPLFILIEFPIDIHALFIRKLEWKKIPHKSTIKIHNLLNKN